MEEAAHSDCTQWEGPYGGLSRMVRLDDAWWHWVKQCPCPSKLGPARPRPTVPPPRGKGHNVRDAAFRRRSKEGDGGAGGGGRLAGKGAARGNSVGAAD